MSERAQEFESAPKYKPHPDASKRAWIKSMKDYEKRHKESIEKNDEYWAKMAKEYVTWSKDFDMVKQGCFEKGNHAWYTGGELNVSYNCVDRHLKDKPNQVALLWEGNKPHEKRTVTFLELHEMVCKCANMLKSLGVKKGDRVCMYLPMVPELAVSMLASSRIGAIHSIVFAGFSAESLRDRIIDAKCEIVFVADEGCRGEKFIGLKKTVDAAVAGLDFVRHVIVYKRTGNEIPWTEGRDLWWHEQMDKQRGYCPAVPVASEDELFVLYTSGSTGKPKGIIHTTGGYLVYAAHTHKMIFDYHPGDIFACVADIGWITGHSYIVYGPLCNGATTFLFEGTPLWPDANRYWDMVQRHKINQFYTAPTAIRSLIQLKSDPSKYDLSSLKVLGTVGECINPAAWDWYYQAVGGGKRPIVDTFWQTETGGIVITPLPGATTVKPGSATYPFFGIQPVIYSQDKDAKELKGNSVQGVLCMKKLWPGLCRTIYGDHDRFLKTYMAQYPGNFFTGDGAFRDKDGCYWITGRVDDVVNVSGHRIGSAEVEHALVSHANVAESAVIGIPHEVKGQCLFAYVILKGGFEEDATLLKELITTVRTKVGGLAVPDTIVITKALPKTRSGKIMRRILRKIATQETDSLGDTSTLADPSVVQTLIELVQKKLQK